MADAKFEDGDDGPLRLLVQGAEDLSVASALLQDAVLPVSELRYDRKRRSFGLLVNRFRWEDAEAARKAGRGFERVRCLVVFDGVLSAKTQGIDPKSGETILSLLSVEFAAKDDVSGRVTLNFAGDGAIALEVEALDLRIEDVTKPYYAPSRKAPDHRA